MKTYKIAEASDITGFSQQAIYKYLDYFSSFFNGNIENKEGVTVLTEEGLGILEEIKSLKKSNKTRLKDVKEALYENRKNKKTTFTENIEESTKTEKEVLKEQIEFLREQLNKKDEQLQVKDDQIAELHQIIALQEKSSLSQQKMLEDMRDRSFWKKLKTAFGFSS